MSSELAFEVHALTARLDRAADRLLRAERRITYRRFLVLFMVGDLGADSQRALAEKLDVSEPSVSRMTGVLKEAGLLTVTPARGARRHELALTREGQALMDDCKRMLGERLAAAVQRSGVPIERYLEQTRSISHALDEAEVQATGVGPAAAVPAAAAAPAGAR